MVFKSVLLYKVSSLVSSTVITPFSNVYFNKLNGSGTTPKHSSLVSPFGMQSHVSFFNNIISFAVLGHVQPIGWKSSTHTHPPVGRVYDLHDSRVGVVGSPGSGSSGSGSGSGSGSSLPGFGLGFSGYVGSTYPGRHFAGGGLIFAMAEIKSTTRKSRISTEVKELIK